MLPDEARRLAESRAAEHFSHRTDETPLMRDNFIRRETARLLGEPVPSWLENPRAPRRREASVQSDNLAALLQRSLQEVRR